MPLEQTIPLVIALLLKLVELGKWLWCAAGAALKASAPALALTAVAFEHLPSPLLLQLEVDDERL